MPEIMDKTTRPPREQQAWDEIGVTQFDPGVRWFLMLGFTLTISLVSALQFMLPKRIYNELSGKRSTPNSEDTYRVSGKVMAVTSGPQRNAVYNDFIMKLQLSELKAINPAVSLPGSSAVLAVQAMRERNILPIASLKVGDNVRFNYRPWDEVASQLGGLMASEFEDLALLDLPQLWATAIEVEGQAQHSAAGEFLKVWSGAGVDLTPDARMPVHLGMLQSWSNADTLLDKFIAANSHLARRIGVYEKALDDAFIVTLALRSSMQELLLRLGVGNEKAYVGRDGWLFYEPDVKSLTSSGFLESEELRRRARSGNSFSAGIAPDSRVAIRAFNEQLKSRGIKLILMPTPVKPTIHPEKLSHRLEGFPDPLRNRSFEQWLNEISAYGVHIFDPAVLLKDRAKRGEPQYLATDTHWAPHAMQAVAQALAAQLAAWIPDRTTNQVQYVSRPTRIEQLGDIGTMLELPRGQRLLQPEAVEVEQVYGPDKRPWSPTSSCEVLLLGDSFTNIYSLEGMGWGSHAGFAEHLSLELKQPLTRLSRNDSGAYATRELLADALRTDPRYLDRCRVVIWQFAERELSSGDWRMIELPPFSEVSKDEAAATLKPLKVPGEYPKGEKDPAHAQDAALTVEEIHAKFQALSKDAQDQPAIAGKDGWIFLRSELRHLGAGPYWGEHASGASKAGSFPDPLLGLTDLNEKLKALKIRLILLPVPARAAVYPDKLLERVPLTKEGLPQRSDLHDRAFFELLRKQGVEVLDLTDAFIAARKEDLALGPVCCEQDSHWSPRGIALAADCLTEKIGQPEWLATGPRITSHLLEAEPFTYKGDLVDLIGDLAGGSRTIQLRRVSIYPDRFESVPPNTESPVLLIADSHGLVFHSGGDMHTQGAGLADLLAHRLGISVDLMARRGSGASVRIELARRFLRDPAVASSKRVLIYFFATRFLTESESWRPVPLRKE